MRSIAAELLGFLLVSGKTLFDDHAHEVREVQAVGGGRRFNSLIKIAWNANIHLMRELRYILTCLWFLLGHIRPRQSTTAR